MLKTKKGILLKAQVKPQSRSFRIQVDDELVIFCKESPIEGEVNRELVKELSKTFRRKVEIVSGFRSKTKRILIEDAIEEEVLQVLEYLKQRGNV